MNFFFRCNTVSPRAANPSLVEFSFIFMVQGGDVIDEICVKEKSKTGATVIASIVTLFKQKVDGVAPFCSLSCCATRFFSNLSHKTLGQCWNVLCVSFR
jgi:hypothetical protein